MNKSFKEKKDKIKQSKKPLSYYEDNASKQIKALNVDMDEEIELLQKERKELKLEKDRLPALLAITEYDMVTTFGNGKYVNGIGDIYIKLLDMNAERNNFHSIIQRDFGSNEGNGLYFFLFWAYWRLMREVFYDFTFSFFCSLLCMMRKVLHFIWPQKSDEGGNTNLKPKLLWP